MERLHAAIRFATERHDAEVREGDVPLPYITHPVEVLLLLRYVGGVSDEELLCAAALHDTVESGVATLAEIRDLCGDRTAELVRELTRYEPTAAETAGMTKAEIWELRSETLLSEIGRMGPDAQQVKLADRLANVREGKRTKRGEKLSRYLKQTRRILEIIPRTRNRGLWEAIEAEVRG